MDILDPRRLFKSGVQVDADALWMVEGPDALNILWTNATAEQKWGAAMIACQDIPVELEPIASHRRPFGVEEEIVNLSFVGFDLFQIVGRGDAEGLDQLRGYGGRTLVGNGLTQQVDVGR